MEKEMLLTIILGLLVLVSAVQAYQIIGLKNSGYTAGSPATGTEAASRQSSAPQGSGSGVPTSLQNVPDMVGGC